MHSLDGTAGLYNTNIHCVSKKFPPFNCLHVTLLWSALSHRATITKLWSPYVIGQTIIFLPCGFFFSFFSSPNLSGRRLDVYHTCTHGVALVRIYNAGLKRAARGSLESRHLGTIAQLCRAISSQLRHRQSKKTC